MKIYEGKPEKEGWYFNVIHRTGCFNDDPSNFIGLWTDYYNEKDGDWLINNGYCKFWAELPEIITDDNKFLLKSDKEDSLKFILTPGMPDNPGCYILALQPKTELFCFFEKKIDQNLLKNIGAVLQSDRFNPDSYFCEDLDSVIGWVKFPELIFQDGTTINFNK